MAGAVVWASRAVEDVDAIASYIGKDSAAYASAVVKKILATTRLLEKFPLSGRVVPEVDDSNLREQLAYNYRTIYRVRSDSVLIVAIIHGKRMLAL